jgi:hypothetical protein
MGILKAMVCKDMQDLYEYMDEYTVHKPVAQGNFCDEH